MSRGRCFHFLSSLYLSLPRDETWLLFFVIDLTWSFVIDLDAFHDYALIRTELFPWTAPLQSRMAFLGSDGWKAGLSAAQVCRKFQCWTFSIFTFFLANCTISHIIMDGFQERKVSDLEKQVEVLEKERKQRTFQMETCEQMFESQKRKTEDEKAQNVQVKRELQSLEDR